MKYEEYIISPEWYQIKVELLTIRGCKCEICGKDKPPNKLQVHHLTYKRLFKEEPRDLQLLCGKCHMGIHNIGVFANKKHSKKNKVVISVKSKPSKKKKHKKKVPQRKRYWEYCPPNQRMDKRKPWGNIKVTIEDFA